jgi:hypothetical protein
MAINNQRFNKKSQGSILGKLIAQSIGETSNILNALDFIESPQGFATTLSPVQRMIVRAFFGIPFDYRPEMPSYEKALIWDKFRDNVLYEFDTEAELLRFFYNEGRCNVKDWRDIPTEGFNEAAIFAGRRGGKSQVVSAIGGYALYKLLNIRSPQEYYGLREGSAIDFTFMAAEEEGSNRLYDKLRTDINNAPFFTPYIRVNTNSEMGFVSEADRNKRDIIPSIRVASYPCTTNALRGPSSLFLALDEFAHFRATKDTSSDKIYESATPATMRFLAGGQGRRESMILSISSPWQRIGKMYELHKHAMDKGINSGIFTLRCSTTEMYPYADSQFLHQKYDISQMTWKAEYGGEFLDSSETYVKGKQFDICVDDERKNIVHFHPSVLGRQYFWGLDLGMQHDGTALAIGHLEFSDQIGIELVYDYIDRMMVDETFEGPGVPDIGLGERPKYVGYTELPLQDIVLWLKAMHDILPCFKGVTDQHGGSMLVQLLQINGINGMELVHLTPAINSEMYYALKGYIDNKRTRFPNVPKFTHEIKQIEAQVVAKYQLRVKAPEEKGSHDDLCDAVALVAWQAMNYLENDGRLMLDPTGMSFAMQERISKPPAIVGDISNISMRDLKILERQSKILANTPLPGFEIIKNPFHRRGR